MSTIQLTQAVAWCRHLGNADVMLMLTSMPVLKMDLDVSAGIFGGWWGSK